MQTRCRFAPSPTGFFHIGSARTALFNWLFARHTGGAFVLRIEDTDKERNDERFVELIHESLRWLGLDWDEGPGVGGAYGPYRQSERGDVYREHLARLQQAGRVYQRDGAWVLRLEGERYRDWDPMKKAEVEKVKAPPVVIDDIVRGRVERAEEQDFVIVRSNGEPVFHFVNVVDDITMRITHVIRGEDHLSNTSKHILLYQALGAPLPRFAHIPLILKSSGPGKMSKRDQGALIEEYQRRHYVPEAVRNYLCLLGWSPKDNREKMPIEEVVRLFQLEDVLAHNARFDERKMNHLNAAWLAEWPLERWLAAARAFLAARGALPAGTDQAYADAVLALCREKLRSIEETEAFTRYFFTEDYPIDPKARDKVAQRGDPVAPVSELLAEFEAAEPFDAATLEARLQALAARTGRQPADYIHPCRLAVSGVSVGPSLYGMLEVLGRARVLARLRKGVSPGFLTSS